MRTRVFPLIPANADELKTSISKIATRPFDFAKTAVGPLEFPFAANPLPPIQCEIVAAPSNWTMALQRLFPKNVR